MSNQSGKASLNRLTALVLCFLTLLALGIRLQYARNTVYYNPIVADARQYVLYGYNLYNHGVYSKSEPGQSTPTPDSYRSPGYPLLIYLTYKLSGGENYYTPLIYIQIIFSTLLVPLTFWLAYRWLNLYLALLAALMVAISPHLVSMSNYVLTETMFSFWLLSAMVSYEMAQSHKKSAMFLLAGLLFGMAYLTNETALFIPFLFALIILLRSPYHITRKDFVNTGTFILIFILFPIGWSIHNHIQVPPTSTSGSQRAINSLTHGAYPDFLYNKPEFKYFPYKEDPMQPLFSSSLKNFAEILWERFKQRPVRYMVWYTFEKPYYLWSWNILQGQGDVYVYSVLQSWYQRSKIANFSRIFMQLIHPFIVGFALIGIFLFLIFSSLKIPPPFISFGVIFIILIILYYTLLYTVFAPWPRYSIPLRPQLYILALWAIQSLYQLRKAKD